jgi:hypothetical protein
VLKQSRALGGLLASLVATGIVLGVAAPASAATWQVPGAVCSVGSYYTRATANYNVAHWTFGPASVKSFPSTSPTLRITTYYTGYPGNTGGKITNNATISSASSGCAD